MSKVLDGLKYTKQHEWIKIDGDIAIVGITDFAQHSLGDIVYLETKDVGEKVEMGESIGTIESVKAAEDIYSPIGGTIAEKNEELISSPEKINKDPYGSWIIKLKNFNIEDLNQLMSSEEYKQYIDSLEQE
jgi:glycine cleavage system H protein